MTTSQMVHRTPILCSTTVVFSVWERGTLCTTHSSITSDEQGWLGRLGTRRLPAELEALPAGDERSTRVRAFHAEQYEAAYAAIVAEYGEKEPAVLAGRRSMGEIEIQVAR